MKLLLALLLSVVFGAQAQTLVKPLQGGTGIANNNAATLTRVGNHSVTITTSGTTGITFPTSGTLATTAQLIGGSWASPGAAIGTGTAVAITGTTITAS